MSEEKYVPLFERPQSGDGAAYAPPAGDGTAPYAPHFEHPAETAPYEPLFPEDAPRYDIPEPDDDPADAYPGGDGAEDGGEYDEEYDGDYYEEDGYVFSGEELAREAAETDWRDVEDPEEREELLARRDFFRTLSGVSDVVLVFVLTGVILVLVWLIVSLIRYVAADLPERFTLLRNLGGLPGGGGFLA